MNEYGYPGLEVDPSSPLSLSVANREQTASIYVGVPARR